MWRGVRWVFNTTSRGKSFKNNISVGFSLFWTYLWVAFYETDWDLSWIHNQTQSVFSSLCSMRIYDSEVMSVYLIDWYQNVRPRAMPIPWVELQKFNLKSILCSWHMIRLVIWKCSETAFMSVLSLSSGVWVWMETLHGIHHRSVLKKC